MDATRWRPSAPRTWIDDLPEPLEIVDAEQDTELWRVRTPSAGPLLARKVPVTEPGAAADLEQQLHRLQQLTLYNVESVVGASEQPDSVWVFLEPLASCTTGRLLTSEPITVQQRAILALDLLAGLAELHGEGLGHARLSERTTIVGAEGRLRLAEPWRLPGEANDPPREVRRAGELTCWILGVAPRPGGSLTPAEQQAPALVAVARSLAAGSESKAGDAFQALREAAGWMAQRQNLEPSRSAVSRSVRSLTGSSPKTASPKTAPPVSAPPAAAPPAAAPPAAAPPVSAPPVSAPPAAAPPAAAPPAAAPPAAASASAAPSAAAPPVAPHPAPPHPLAPPPAAPPPQQQAPVAAVPAYGLGSFAATAPGPPADLEEEHEPAPPWRPRPSAPDYRPPYADQRRSRRRFPVVAIGAAAVAGLLLLLLVVVPALVQRTTPGSSAARTPQRSAAPTATATPRPATPTPQQSQSANKAITGIQLTPQGSCVPGSTCTIEADVHFPAAQQPMAVTWVYKVTDVCHGNATTDRPGTTVTAQPGWVHVISDSPVALPQSGSVRVVAETSSPADVTSDPLTIGSGC